MPIAEIEEILLKYRKQEESLQFKYKEKVVEQSRSETAMLFPEETEINPLLAKQRNENLLKVC